MVVVAVPPKYEFAKTERFVVEAPPLRFERFVTFRLEKVFVVPPPIQVPPIAKQPADILRPFANVEEAVPETTRALVLAVPLIVIAVVEA